MRPRLSPDPLAAARAQAPWVSVGEVGFAEQDGVAGGKLADDLVQLAAADGVRNSGQDRAGIPLCGPWTSPDTLRDPAVELLDPEALGPLLLGIGQRLP